MTMSELDKIRENINSIDEQMAQLFQERMEMSRQVAAFKKDRGLSIRDAERERELRDLCDQYRKNDGSYDCLVPGSGGKDSCYAAHLLK